MKEKIEELLNILVVMSVFNTVGFKLIFNSAL